MKHQTYALSRFTPVRALQIVVLLTGLLAGAATNRVLAAEYAHTYVYNGGTNVNCVWWDDATTNVQGVIVHMNYAAGAGLYYNGNWRSFAAARNFAMMLSINQDSLASASDGVNVVVSNTLKSVAAQSGHAELTAWQPYIFTGLSRGGGGANGAIAQGWIAGTNRTIACLAYHGNSLVYNLYADTASKKAVPVLYLIASLDDPAQGRQGDIEDWVRQGVIYGYSLRLNGALWTTSMQYGVVHNSTGDDTYILQWLGRCIDARLDNSNRSKLKPIVLTNGYGINYTMANANTYNCAFTKVSVASTFVPANKMIWLPPGNDSEWLWENATPRIGSITSSTNVAYLGQPSNVNVSAYTPNSLPVTYQWGLISKPSGGSATFGNSNAASTTVTFSGAPGLYTLRALVTSDPGITNSAQVVFQVGDLSLRYYWQGDGVTNAWDFTSTNWLYQGQPGTYVDPGVTAGSVVFNDAGSASPAVALSTVVQPSLVTFSNVANSYTLSGAGRISGASALVLATPGAVTLLITNDYSGPTTIAAGATLQVGNGALSGSLGAGNVINHGAINFNLPDVRAVAGSISGSGALTTSGAGTLNLLQTNTYAGPTTITNGGTIRLGSGAAASLPVTRGLSCWLDMSVTNNVVRNGANVVQVNDLTGNGNHFFVASGGTGPTLLSGTNGVNGLGVLHFVGSDAERLVLSNSSSSQTVFFSCRVNGSSSGADGIWGRNGGDNGVRVANGTSWAFPGNGNDFANGTGGAMYVNGVATNIFVTAQQQVMTVFAGSNNGFPWAQTGLGSYFNGRDFHGDVGEVLVYSTVLTPSERQTVEGYLMAKWGITAPAATNVLPAGTALAMGSGSRLDLTNSSQSLATITGAGMITNSGLANVQLTIGAGLFSGPIGGALGLTVVGPGTLTLLASNTYTGLTMVNPGTTLQLGNGVLSSCLGSGNVTNNGALNFNLVDTQTVSGIISGPGSLTKAGVGTLALASTNAYTGATIVLGGTLKVGTALVSGLYEGLVSASSGTDTTDPIPVTRIQPVARWGASTTGGGNNVFPAWGDNTTWGYSGYIVNTTSRAITYKFGKNFDDNAYLKIDGVAVIADTSWSSTVTGSITLTPGAHTLDLRFGQIGGGVGPTSPGNYGGFGVAYNTVSNTATGGTWYQMGAGDGSTAFYAAYQAGALSPASPVSVAGGATLDLGDFPQYIASISDIGGGGGVVTNSGTSTAQLSVGSGNFSGVMAGRMGLALAGPGMLTLSGMSTYSGTTIVSNGMLLVNGVLGTNAVSVLNGVLGGSGKLGGAVTLQGGGTLAPGPVPGLPGKLAITGKYAVSNAAAVLAIDLGGTNQADGSGRPTNSYDFVSIGGATVLNGSLNLRLTNNFVPCAMDSFTILTAAGGLSGAFTNVLGGRVAVANYAYGSFLVATTATSVVLTNFQVLRPVIGNISMSGGQITTAGTNGTAGGNYYVLSTTNLALPAPNWSVVSTNQFGPGGSFIYSNVLDLNASQTFYRLRLP